MKSAFDINIFFLEVFTSAYASYFWLSPYELCDALCQRGTDQCAYPEHGLRLLRHWNLDTLSMSITVKGYDVWLEMQTMGLDNAIWTWGSFFELYGPVFLQEDP